MARPKKNNADYFTHDADMRNDVRIKAVRRKFKLAGYAIWNYILEVLTDSEYFEIEWTDLAIELLSADFDVEISELKDVTDYCVTLGLLQLENGKLFSETHQNRLTTVVEYRNKQRNNGRKGGNPNFRKGITNPYYNAPETLPKDNLAITDPYVSLEKTLPEDNPSIVEKSIEEKSKGDYLIHEKNLEILDEQVREDIMQDRKVSIQNCHLFTRWKGDPYATGVIRAIPNGPKTITVPQIWDWMDKFMVHLTGQGVEKETAKEFQRYFFNWIKIEIPKQQKLNNPNKTDYVYRLNG